MKKSNNESSKVKVELEYNRKILYILREYINYVKKFNEDNKHEYLKIDKIFQENSKKVDEILKDFDLVKFSDYEGKLSPYFEKDGHKIFFGVDMLFGKSIEDRFWINRFDGYIKEDEKRLEELNIKEEEVKKKISETKPAKSKKILGIFTDPDDKVRVEKVYKRKLGKLNNELQDIMDEKDMVQFQIDSKKMMINQDKMLKLFIKNLSVEEKNYIKSKYNQVDKVYEIDKFYQMKLEALNSRILTLSKYVEKLTDEEPMEVLFPLIKKIYYLYRELPDNKKNLYFSELSEYYDFGQYEEEMKVLGLSMENREFGKINRFILNSYEEELNKKNSKDTLLNQNDNAKEK